MVTEFLNIPYDEAALSEEEVVELECFTAELYFQLENKLDEMGLSMTDFGITKFSQEELDAMPVVHRDIGGSYRIVENGSPLSETIHNNCLRDFMKRCLKSRGYEFSEQKLNELFEIYEDKQQWSGDGKMLTGTSFDEIEDFIKNDKSVEKVIFRDVSYLVTYEKNGLCQAMIVNAPSESIAKDCFCNSIGCVSWLEGAVFLSCRGASWGDLKPELPVMVSNKYYKVVVSHTPLLGLTAAHVHPYWASKLPEKPIENASMKDVYTAYSDDPVEAEEYKQWCLRELGALDKSNLSLDEKIADATVTNTSKSRSHTTKSKITPTL